MNHRSDIDRVIEVWMADGPTAIPDRVVDVVAARIVVQRQRRTWPFPGRTTMTTPIKLIAGLAAAIVVAVVGWQLLPGTTGPGTPTTAASPNAQPTAAVTAAPSPTASVVLPPWYDSDVPPTGAGVLRAGSHTTTSFRPGFTFSVPQGWVNDGDEARYFSLFPDTPSNETEFARSETFAQTIVMGVNHNLWFTCESVENNQGATVAEIVAAASTTEALAVSEPVDVAIGGLTGKQVDVRRNPDWTGTCPGDSELPPGLDPEDERTRGVLLDIPGSGVLAIFLYSMSSADFEAFLAEAMPIVESFQFDLGQ